MKKSNDELEDSNLKLSTREERVSHKLSLSKDERTKLKKEMRDLQIEKKKVKTQKIEKKMNIKFYKPDFPRKMEFEEQTYKEILTRGKLKDLEKLDFRDQDELDRGVGFDANQFKLLLSLKQYVSGPILEVGSKQTGNTTSFRTEFPNEKYLGLDLESGNNVDVICDLTKGIAPLKEQSFNLIICCSVLEHTPYPWLMAENMTSLLAPGGIMYLSVPWIWRYHKYPDDYFRFTPPAIKSLFPKLNWTHTFFHTNMKGDIYHSEEPGVENSLSLIGITEDKKFRKFLPCTMLTMVGQRPK